jgi:hypothetical protein
MKLCSVEGCGEKHKAKGFCYDHYMVRYRAERTSSGYSAQYQYAVRWHLQWTAINPAADAARVAEFERRAFIRNMCKHRGLPENAALADIALTIYQLRKEIHRERH